MKNLLLAGFFLSVAGGAHAQESQWYYAGFTCRDLTKAYLNEKYDRQELMIYRTINAWLSSYPKMTDPYSQDSLHVIYLVSFFCAKAARDHTSMENAYLAAVMDREWNKTHSH